MLSPTASGQQVSPDPSAMETPPTVPRIPPKFKFHTPDGMTRALEYTEDDNSDADTSLCVLAQQCSIDFAALQPGIVFESLPPLLRAAKSVACS